MKDIQNKNLSLLNIAKEFFSYKEHWIFILPAMGIIAYWLLLSIQYGFSSSSLVYFILGWLIFLPQEYLTHIYVLHAPMPKKNKWFYTHWYRLHYGHHDLPKRHDLMYMPMWLTVPMMLLNLALFWLISNNNLNFATSYLGATFGYLTFEWYHLLCHVPYNPKSKIWYNLRNQHNRHHYLHEKYWYSVSPPAYFLDKIFGTSADYKKITKSNTGRHLEMGDSHPWLLAAREKFAKDGNGQTTSSSRLWDK